MEVFSVFATLSLKDLMSGALGKLRGELKNFDAAVAGVGARMGNLALAMGPAAIGAGAILGAFGKCVSVAAGFEDQMAKVGAVSRATGPELAALEAKARELGATTQFTASQVGEAEQYLAMAGFKAQQNIAALPGVLNLAAATATDLGRAADISSDILGAFGMKAEEMTRVADVLAMTCATANTDMEKLGDTMKYVAPIARTAGLSIEETAAMAGLLGNVGIKGSQAGTSLKAMLNKLAAPASEGAKALAKLGIATKDSAGNLRSPVKILGEMAGKLEKMGTAEQMAAMKAVVGEEAVAGFAELIKQGGIGELKKYIKVLEESGGATQKMADQMNNTLAGDMRGLGSAFESVQITIGKIFIPVLRKVVQAITAVIRVIDKFAQSPIGKFILKLVAAISTGILVITAFAGGVWAVSKAIPAVTKGLALMRTAALAAGKSFLAVSLPILALTAVVAALYLVWKNDFAGIATTVSNWYNKISLVFKGVEAVFKSLQGSTGKITGQLAKDIQANGLVDVVTTVGKVVYRIRQFFSGLWEGLNFDRIVTAIMPALLKVRELFDAVGNAISKLFSKKVEGGADAAKSFGQIIGGALTWSMEALCTIITQIVNGIDIFISAIRAVWALITGDFSTAGEMCSRIWDDFCDNIMAAADLLGIGDWLRNAFAGISDWFSGLVSDIKSIWGSVTGFFSNLGQTIENIWNGIVNFFKSIVADIIGAGQAVIDFLGSLNPIDALTGAFAGIGDFISGIDLVSGFQSAWDAVTGFFSGVNLFESGAKLLGTLKDGVMSMAGSLLDSVTGVFGKLRNLLPFSDAKEGPLSELTASGSAIMTTLGEGVAKGEAALTGSVADALGNVNNELEGFQGPVLDTGSLASPTMPDLDLPQLEPALPPVAAIQPKITEPGSRAEENSNRSGNQTNTQTITIHIGQITLPDVTDSQSFAASLKTTLQNEIGQFG